VRPAGRGAFQRSTYTRGSASGGKQTGPPKECCSLVFLTREEESRAFQVKANDGENPRFPGHFRNLV
jgi:hypothetical protein